MREIKFRCWDKKRKEMINLRPAELSNTQGAHIALAFEEYGHTRSDEFERIEDYEVMQYTGLLDNNGVEIYEGDIVSVDNDENPVITKCIWDIGQFILEDKSYGEWTRQLYHHPERLLVIGNIYENPELL